MNSPSSSQTLETICAMRRQQEQYLVSDYLSDIPTAKATPIAFADSNTPVDVACRHVMATWCNQIADSCQYKRETVAIAMNCLDRFMATPTGHEILLDRNLYQLAVMTALYSSVKIHEQQVMDSGLISKLSRGAHTPEAVEAMELKMLIAIQWRVNQPTAMSFVRTMVALMSEHQFLSSSTRETIIDIAKYQIEMIINKYDFCHTYDSSTIASACVLNAIESVAEDDMLYALFEGTIGKAIHIDDKSVKKLRTAIYELVNDNGKLVHISHAPVLKSNWPNDSYSTTKRKNIHSSPIAVNSYDPC